MNKERPKPFEFIFPLIDKSTNKAITELQVLGIIDTGRLNEALDYKIRGIYFFAPGERTSSDIKSLLYFINREIYNEICAAALNHATEMYGLKKYTLVTN